MLDLILVRHAKSDWFRHTADIDRPLSDRGTQDADRMGAYLGKMDIVPDRMVVSSARRTLETANLLLNNLPVTKQNVLVEPRLYLADKENLCEIIELYANENQCLLVLAHNPGMDDLVHHLTRLPLPRSASGKLMTTCAVACFRLNFPGALRKSGQAECLHLFRPKEIGDCKFEDE